MEGFMLRVCQKKVTIRIFILMSLLVLIVPSSYGSHVVSFNPFKKSSTPDGKSSALARRSVQNSGYYDRLRMQQDNPAWRKIQINPVRPVQLTPRNPFRNKSLAARRGKGVLLEKGSLGEQKQKITSQPGSIEFSTVFSFLDSLDNVSST